MEIIKVPTLTRELAIEGFVLRKAGDVYRMSFSAASSYPVERYFGSEVLDFSKGAVRLERATRGAMPLLFNHDMNRPLGMVDSMSVVNGRLMVNDSHFFDTTDAQQARAMVEGGLHNVSVGYRLHEVSDQGDTQRVTDWEPYEVSIVTVPADPTVGIGRDLGGEEFEVRIVRAAKTSAAAAVTIEDRKMDEETKTPAASVSAEQPVQVNAAQMEVDRKRAIGNMCKANNIDDKVRDMWVGQGLSIEAISDDLVKLIEERTRANPQSVARIGLNPVETRRYSMLRAIEAAATQNWTKAGFELECHRAIDGKLSNSAGPHTFHIPFEVLGRDVVSNKRDLTVATAGAGGYLVETQNLGFIEQLRNRSAVFRMGATRLSGLVGSVSIPRQTVAGTAVWLANEASTITENQQTFVQIALTPKNVGAYTEISRQLLLQSSPSAEGIVTSDLAQVVAIAVDLAALEGSGAGGQPTGISQTAGIGSVSGTSLAAAGVLEFQSDIATGNIMPMSFGYVTTPAVAALLMVRPELPTTGTTRLWTGNLWDGNLFGFPAMATNQVTAATMVAGDWSKLVVAEWGTLSVEVNPYANFQAGIVGVRAIYSLDIGVRIPVAFSRATTIT